MFILNDASAVRTFSQAGSLTLGGNVSIAAGPIGRNAEAAGAASTKGVAGIFSYSRTKGLFAGVSLEGSVLVERKDANEKLYGSRVSAAQLLGGNVPPPPGAEAVMRILQSRAFTGYGTSFQNDSGMYNDIPVYDDRHDDVVWEGRRGEAMGQDSRGGFGSPRRAATTFNSSGRRAPPPPSKWTDDVYDQQPSGGIGRSYSTRANPNETFDTMGGAGAGASRGRSSTFNNDYVYRDEKPARPTAPKPVFNARQNLGKNQAVALFTFDADQEGDLGFKKGDVITILKRTEKKEDWWTGQVGNKVGIFPR